MHKIISYGNTNVGFKRSNNEDSFLSRMDLGFCLVADGMGGAAAGELASKIFSEATLEVFSNSESKTEKQMVQKVQTAFHLANKRILEHIKSNPTHRGMGCTAELAAFAEDGIVLGHIGDSRVYRHRDNALKQLSRDHSFVQEQLDQGQITPKEARKHPLRNVILRAVGINENLPLDILRIKPRTGDVFLLCSDGLTDMVEDEEIEKVLSSTDKSLEDRVDELIGLALVAGGNDNVTVVLTEIR